MSEDELRETAPHLPALDAEDLDTHMATWQQEHPDEVTALLALQPVADVNPAPAYLGLDAERVHAAPASSLLQWIEASGITDARLHSIAPHYPSPDGLSAEDFQLEEEVWMRLYGHEYELLINDRQMTRLNPYYDGYEDVVQIPAFIRPLTSTEKPEPVSTGDSRTDVLEHALDLQAWYFIFEPESFADQYGFEPRFPAWFNPDHFRSEVIRKIEEGDDPGTPDQPDDQITD
mgnify:FL=1